MDALDLSLGEKRSRRKTNMPMRRQGLEKETRTEDIHEDNHDNGSATENDNHYDNNETENSEQKRNFLKEKKLGDIQFYDDGNKTFTAASKHIDSAKSYCSTPSDEGKEGVESSSRGNSSPNSVESGSRSQRASPYDSTAEYRGNLNNNNNQHVVSLTRFPQLPNLSIPQPDLSAFQERFSGFASHSRSRIGHTSKHSSRIPYSAYDVQPIDTPGIPERTKKQNRWAFNVWREWARKRNHSAGSSTGNIGSVPLDVGQASEGELDYWLSKFVQEIRRKDGNPYPPHTLMQIVMGIQRYLRQQAGRPQICILDRSNPVYGRFRSVLDIRIKELTTEGVTASSKAGRRSGLPSSSGSSGSLNHNSYGGSAGNYPEESVLWSAGIIGNDTALRLLNSVFYHNTVTFGIRNIDDHWNLKISHFVLGNRGQQTEAFIEFLPSSDPVYTKRGMTKDRKIYADPNNPRCVVKIFQKYLSLIPPEGPFYRHPQEPTLVDKSIRFSDQWVGKNRLRAMIKHIFDSTRLDGKERGQTSATVSNHSSSKYATNSHNQPNEDPASLQPSVYDRLAQVMMQLSYMRSSPQVGGLANSSPLPLNPNTPPPKPESTDFPSPPPAQAISGRHEIVLKRESSPDILSGSSKPKKSRPLPDGGNQAEEFRQDTTVDDVSDDVKVTSSSSYEKPVQENMLEISVPSNIEAITVIKGSKKITIQLD